ncbi:hypothetical protein INT43_007229 [Umbelopsis isabellina]|uniref:Uncharacterized protein n=1 Tax=Mortierella isabellina TaxID=91625 RepID=A0A8H7UHV7_MORIS|nr:hypothetical protein INT43_007229 [Umbelopsis isabellina]
MTTTNVTTTIIIPHKISNTIDVAQYLDRMDDPITHYDNEIRRILKYHSSEDVRHLDTQLLSVLKAAIFYIQKQERYRNDPRYLRIWLMYAAYYDDPMHVYSFLARISIGTYLGAFYETVADYLEKCNRCLEALTVLSVGVLLHAEPQKRLKQKKLACQAKHASVIGPKLSDELHANSMSTQPKHNSHNRLFTWDEWASESSEQILRQYQLIMGAPASDNHREKGHEWWDAVAWPKASTPKKSVYLKSSSGNHISFEESRAKKVGYLDQNFSQGKTAVKQTVLTSLHQGRDIHKSSRGLERFRSSPNETSRIASAQAADMNCDSLQRIIGALSPLGSHRERNLCTAHKCEQTNTLKGQNPQKVEASTRNLLSDAVVMDNEFFRRMAAAAKDLLYQDQNYINRTSEAMPLKSKFRLIHSFRAFHKFMLKLSPYSLSVTAFIAQGGNAKVFMATDMDGSVHGMKIESPPSAYEYCIIKSLRTALGSVASSYIVQPVSFHHYKDAGCLLMEYCSQGTLLNAVNLIRKAKMDNQSTTGMDETLAMFLTMRLLQIVIALHQHGFVHGDLKADNVMVNFEVVNENIATSSSMSTKYVGKDDAYWSLKHIKLIDFGKAIDTNLFPKGQRFLKCWQTNKHDDAPQVHANKEWEPWIVDYWGMAKTVHCLLFGLDMQVSQKCGHYNICQRPKRWWDEGFWNKFFRVLLNPGVDLPITNVLIAFQDELKTILTDRENKNRLRHSVLQLQQLL